MLLRSTTTFMLIWASTVAAPAFADKANPSVAPKPDRKGIAFFESRIRPVLVKHCYDCHSVESGSAEGGLRVDSRRALRKGGKRGPAVVPGKPQASWLLKAVRHTDNKLQMPPKQKRLPDTVIADVTAWIKMGAPDPRADNSGKAIRRADRSFWAYQPPKEPSLPNLKSSWSKHPIDRFVLAKLKTKGLAPSPDAEWRVLLRRLHFDLIGLPPGRSDIDRFRSLVRANGLEAALVAEVDRLLASPRFGEKWGRHWLDVARFGESSGGEANISFPYAWRYRDYVIDAVNADVPFDRFLVEQIAGDLLPHSNNRERAQLLIATGFLAVGPKNLDQASAKQFRADVIDEQIDAVSRAVMASSIACARCHDHKFDAFSMRDYYALAGIFASTKTYFGTAVSPANRVGGDPLPLPGDAGLKTYHRSISEKRVRQLKAQLAAMQKEKKDKQAAVLKAVREGRDPRGIFTLRDALRIFWRSGSIEGQLEKVDDNGKALPLAMGVLEAKTVGDAPLLERGDVSRPTKRVARAFPSVIQTTGRMKIPPTSSGRLELARWLTHPKHPLTGRVFVNRTWYRLIGSGLVPTIDNFGATGARPTHPKLLDYLATRLVKNGWSRKKLIREIVLSRTYRQASTFNRKAFLMDPDNRLLWRRPKRRLDAEAIRDAMLAVSGELNTSRPEASLVGRVIGDRPISLIGLDKRVPPDLDGSVHRSVYLPAIRDRLPEVLDLFDFADPSLVTGRRETTNVPVQALYLLNSPFVQKRAAAFASRLSQGATTNEQRVKTAFRLCFGRSPDPVETRRSLAFLKSKSNGTKGQSGLVRFCQALLCTAEFRNLD